MSSKIPLNYRRSILAYCILLLISGLLNACSCSMRPTGLGPVEFDEQTFSDELKLTWQEKINILGDGNPKFVDASVFVPRDATINAQSDYLISRPSTIRTRRAGFVVDYVLRKHSDLSASRNAWVSVGFDSLGELVSVQVSTLEHNGGIRASIDDAKQTQRILEIVKERIQRACPGDGLDAAVYWSASAVISAVTVVKRDRT